MKGVSFVGNGMIRFLITLLITFVSLTMAQNDTLTSTIDTLKSNEVNLNNKKAAKEFKPLSLTYLKMSTPLSDLNLNSDALFYSQNLVQPNLFNSPFNNQKVEDFLKYLRPRRIGSEKRIMNKILNTAMTAAAVGVMAVHVHKYWNKYKEDFGF